MLYFSQTRGSVALYVLIGVIVIVVIGFVAWFFIPALKSVPSKNQDADRVADVKAITYALELYALDNAGQYPNNLIPLSGPDYLDAPVPADPLDGQSYSYQLSNDGNYYTVCATLSTLEPYCLTNQ